MIGWRGLVVAGLQGTLAIAPLALFQAPPLCPAQLEARLNAIVDRPEFHRARWGILVQPLGEPDTLYERNAEQFFIPASNVKLLTTAAALTSLGAEFRLRTSVYRLESGASAAIAPPSLAVVGQGDPSLTDAELHQLAQQLRHQGITQITTLTAVAERDAIANPTWSGRICNLPTLPPPVS
ncbi:MAG: hypothetical protein HC881_21160 [Leptolyngbyaceae cyanobacterium SL_7_1]|nr:hypothetical protein [Leptolyngbyaceae cyanobacterium SL_7_1]